MGTYTHALLRRHTACMLDHTEHEEVPRGWHALVELLLRDMAETLTLHPGVMLEVYQIKEKFGALRVYVHAGKTEAGETALAAIHPLIAAAEAKSAGTCQVCGIPGRQRRTGGRVAALCDAHDPQPMLDDDDCESTWLSAVDADEFAAEEGGAPRRGSPAVAGDGAEAPAPRGSFQLYDLRAVADALGRPAELDEDELLPARTETEHEGRLAAILQQGEAGTWRDLAQPDPACLMQLDALEAAAPHMAEVTALVRRHVKAALAIGLPIWLPPVMLLGEPGLGKSWYLTRLGAALGLPTRTYPMSAATLGEGLQGSHPSWRNAGPGLVARTLLQERLANPLIMVDEVDKPGFGSWNADPYRPFYGLLEPSGARRHKDEYLQFEMDASAVCWVLAGNELTPLPAPIRDRLTVIEIPPLSRAHLAAVAASIYAEANAGMNAFFDPILAPMILEPLLRLTPRAIRLTLQDAMVRAAADGRRMLSTNDLGRRQADTSRIGFRTGEG